MSATWEEYHQWFAERWLDSKRLSEARKKAERNREYWRRRIDKWLASRMNWARLPRAFAFRGLPTFDTERKDR